MIINLNKLPVEIDTNIEISKSFLDKTDIMDIKPVKVKGIIKYNAIDEIVISLVVSGVLVLKDAITNELIDYPYQIEIEEEIAENDQELRKYYEKKQNTLDIIEFLWENIILEVPISFTKADDTSHHGDGWQLNCWDDLEQTDTRFAKLNDIFKGGE